MRPTADRVREAVFARLLHLEGARVLDLYAGTGALGIEALSRGAREAVFVERNPAARACLEANLESLGLAGRSRVLGADVRAALKRLDRGGERFELVLLDPPYADRDVDAFVADLARAALLAPGGTLVREAPRRHPPGEIPGLVVLDERRYGEALVVRYTSPEPSGGSGSDSGPREEDRLE